MEIKLKKKDTISKLMMAICVGLLLLVVVFPTKKSSSVDRLPDEKPQADEIEEKTNYYEERLKAILENTYGADTMEVMIHMAEQSNDSLFYGEEQEKLIVDGVLVVAHVNDSQAVTDITFAVCALFDLPAHKVAVMIKK